MKRGRKTPSGEITKQEYDTLLNARDELAKLKTLYEECIRINHTQLMMINRTELENLYLKERVAYLEKQVAALKPGPVAPKK